MKTSFIGRCTFGLQATMPACICKNSHLYLNTVKSWVIIGHILICPESSYIPFIVYVFLEGRTWLIPKTKLPLAI
jgi:hypothetical protein